MIGHQFVFKMNRAVCVNDGSDGILGLDLGNFDHSGQQMLHADIRIGGPIPDRR